MKLNIKHINLAILAAAFLALSIIACNKDDEGADLTIQIQGTYMGEYAAESDNGTVTFTSVEAVVTKLSNTAANFDVTFLAGTPAVNFKAEMTDEMQFTIPDFVSNGVTLNGSGSLENGTLLKFQLTDSDGVTGNFDGEKQ